jgi:hypothetical protein
MGLERVDENVGRIGMKDMTGWKRVECFDTKLYI